MNFKTFLEIVQKQVNESLPGSLRADLRAVQKNNGAVYTGLTLAGHEASSDREMVTSPVVYLEEFYQRYLKQHTVCGEGQNCGLSEFCTVRDDAEKGLQSDEERGVYPCLKAYSQAIAEILLEYCEHGPEIPDLSDYDAMKDRLFVRLVGHKANKAQLEESANRPFLDMAVLYYLLVEGPDHEPGCIRVSWNMLGDWGVAEDLLYRDALENSRKMLGERLFCFDQDTEEEGEKSGMMVLSNEKNYFGASVILYSEEIRRVSEKLGQDLFILPSSVHEVILLPAEGQDPDALRATVRRINETEVRTEDVLTDSVYRYDRREGRIQVG